MKTDIFDLCSLIVDPRIDRRKVHKLEHIVYISMAAVICGAQTWYEIEEFGQARFPFFKSRLPELESIPSHDTFNRFFSIMDPGVFEEVFRRWARAVCEEVKGVVAIDGKLMRGASKCGEGSPYGREGFKLWMVSAWSAANGISLGQVKVDDKSNEITAVPELLEALDLKGCIVTLDAMGCQEKVAERIVKGGGDYVIALKNNQKTSRRLAEGIIDDLAGMPEDSRLLARHTSTNTGHGRIEERECTVACFGDTTGKMFRNKFAGMRSVVRMRCCRTIMSTGERTEESRYYITSMDAGNAEEIANAIRQHWSIENCLHWQLDVTFREDQGRKVKTAARNFSLLTKMALAMLKKDKATKGSMNLKRLKAGWDTEYLTHIMEYGLF